MEAQLTYASWQWELVLASFVVALFALFATFIYLIVSRSELSSKYRPTGNAGAIVALIATLAYSLLIVSWVVGFDYDSLTRTYTASRDPPGSDARVCRGGSPRRRTTPVPA